MRRWIKKLFEGISWIKTLWEIFRWLSIAGSTALAWFQVQLVKDNDKKAEHIKQDSVIVEKYRSAPRVNCEKDSMVHLGSEKLKTSAKLK